MMVYTYSEARQKLASLLEQAGRLGEVRIRRRDGRVFVIRPEPQVRSPLDVEAIDLGLSGNEIVEAVRESRSRVKKTSHKTSDRTTRKHAR